VERRNGWFETSSMPGRTFTSPADFNAQLTDWLSQGERTGGPHDPGRTGRVDRCRSCRNVGVAAHPGATGLAQQDAAFGDQAVAAAVIDRIVHHADVLTLKGASSPRTGP
jgi:hypothetical protein